MPNIDLPTRAQVIKWLDQFKRENKFKTVRNFREGATDCCPAEFLNIQKKPYAVFVNTLNDFCKDLERVSSFVNLK
jgi:hypothetical protein